MISFYGGPIAEGSWFQYHHLFAEYLLHRLERDDEDRIPELHRRAAQWFTEHQMLSQAVDHLILAGDARQAVDAVEQAATDLMEQSQMSTLIGLAAKLPAQHADGRPRLQVDLAWANVVLHRLAAAEDALRLAEVGIDSVPTDEAGDLRAEMDLIRAVIAAFQDRIDTSTDAAVAACVDRADTLRPFILCRAADLASFRALRVLDFDDALRWQRWGRQYHQRISGTLSASYGYCFAAIAANEQLDVAGAEAHLRHAIRIALLPSGRPTYVAKLAGSLLGELLYERGQLDEAEALLDDAYELGAEGGIVDFMLAAFGTGARLKFARGDKRPPIDDSTKAWRSRGNCNFRDSRLACSMKVSGLPRCRASRSTSRWHGESQAGVLSSSTESAMWQPNSWRMHKSDCS